MALSLELPEGTETIDLDSYEPSQQFSYADYEQPMDAKKTEENSSQESFEQELAKLVDGDTTKIKEEPDQAPISFDVAIQEEEIDMIPQEGLNHEIVASEQSQETSKSMIPGDLSQELHMPDVPSEEATVTSIEEATETDTLEVSGATIQEGPQQEVDACEGAARSSTSPRPSAQNDNSEEQLTETDLLEGLQKSRNSGGDTQEVSESVSKTAQSQSINLGSSVLDAKPDGAIGGHQTAEQLRNTVRDQFKMAKMLQKVSKSTKEPQKSPTQASQPNQQEEPVGLGISPSQLLQAYTEWQRKKENGTIRPDEEVELMKFERSLGVQQRAQTAEESDTEKELFVSENGSRKRKAASNDGPGRSKRPRNNVSATNNRGKTKGGRKSQSKLSSFGASNLFDDADAAEGMHDQPIFERSNVREDALKALKANVPEESRKAAKADAGRVNKAIKRFHGRQSVKPHDDGRWLVSGMRTSLLPSQIISAGFMLRKEAEGSPQGGIIGDQMGLGKTLVSLALIVNSRPKGRDGNVPRTTLVVVPNSLVSQWYKEFATHCVEDHRKKSGINRVRIFRDSESPGYHLKDFEDVDVVLTTYGAVMKSWPDCQYPEGLNEEEKSDYYLKEVIGKRGPLHRQHWYRVILDEAHQIRNVESRTAKGCHNLVTDSAWCLTGTPMINGAADLYSLFTFIKHPKVLPMKLSTFKRQYCNTKDPMSYEALSQELLDCMSRFSHKDKLFDARLVTLPKKRKMDVRLTLTPLEAAIYRVVRDRFRVRAKAALSRDDTVQTKLFNVLALITLLRQLTAHPLMLPSAVCDWLEDEDFAEIESVVNRTDFSEAYGKDSILTMRSVIHYRHKKATRASSSENEEGVRPAKSASRSSKSSKSTGLGTGKKHGKQSNEDYQSFLAALKRKAHFKCGMCERIPDQPMLTDCNHFYCKTHYADMLHAAGRRQARKADCVVEGCGRTIEFAHEEAVTTEMPKWLANRSHMLPSTKTLAVKAQILEWLDPERGGNESAKIVVFTQFLNILSVLEKVCEDEGWGYRTLHGGMKQRTRDEHILEFSTKSDVRIFLSTLKTGGVGLNLTEGRAVINVDPYFNEAIEEQAFGRVYRIGQRNETAFTNLMAKNTVDQRLVNIKKEKKIEIETVIKSHKSRGLQIAMELLDSDDEDDSNEGDSDSEQGEDEEEADE